MNDADSVYEEPAQSFGELGVPGLLVRLLAADGKKTAFPIQQDTLPDSLAGRDVLGRGQTGSGKTLAFGLPLVSRLSSMDRADDQDFADVAKIAAFQARCLEVHAASARPGAGADP